VRPLQLLLFGPNSSVEPQVLSTEAAEEFHKTSAVIRELGQVSTADRTYPRITPLTICLGPAEPTTTRLRRGESYRRAQIYQMLTC
jgi:hypothetical protein